VVAAVAAFSNRSWQPLGEKFFGLLVRARYATTNPEFRAILLEAGVPSKRSELFNLDWSAPRGGLLGRRAGSCLPRGWQGRENVLTAKGLSPLSYLPRDQFFGEASRGHRIDWNF
jgi:hypothetical protein